MPSIREILANKGTSIVCIHPGATVYDAAVRMNEHKIGALVVLKGDELVGIISERDILQRVVAARRDAATTLVQDVMTTDVFCGERETTIDEARGVMMRRRIRHLPIVEEGRLVGLISIGDLNAYRVNNQEMTIHLLNQYIAGQV
jgi:CBS domain-containing protein